MLTRLADDPRTSVSAGIDALRQDRILHYRNLSADDARLTITALCEQLDLSDSLKVQSGFAAFLGHRQTVDTVFMTVNNRLEQQIFPPHSEGNSSVGMQIAALYCSGNTTDGGETVLFNVNDDGPGWPRLKEFRVKAKRVHECSRGQGMMARMRYGVDVEQDILTGEDRDMGRVKDCPADLDLRYCLSPVRKAWSTILGRETHVYWDSISAVDLSCTDEYLGLLRSIGLLRQPPEEFGPFEADALHERKVWRSGVEFSEIFRQHVVHRLEAGDLLVFNNLSWAHSAANWTPGSGSRGVVAAFA